MWHPLLVSTDTKLTHNPHLFIQAKHSCIIFLTKRCPAASGVGRATALLLCCLNWSSHKHVGVYYAFTIFPGITAFPEESTCVHIHARVCARAHYYYYYYHYCKYLAGTDDPHMPTPPSPTFCYLLSLWYTNLRTAEELPSFESRHIRTATKSTEGQYVSIS